jgi:hypothetical protein
MATRPRLLFLLPSLGHGGVEDRFLTLAKAVRGRGGSATVLAAPGALEKRAAECAELHLIDWAQEGNAASYDSVTRVAAGHDAAFVPCDPLLIHTVPTLVATMPVSLGLHNLPGSFPAWFGEVAWRRLVPLLTALHESRGIVLTAASALHAQEHASDLALPEGAVVSSPNGVEIPPDAGPVSSGAIRSVALVVRLSPEKRGHAAAAAALVAAGRARGHEVVLDVYGGGPDEEAMSATIAALLPGGGWQMNGPIDRPAEAFLRADVCVGTGRANLEALVNGRRVVAVKSRPHPSGGQLGPPVSPARYAALAADNFTWRTHEPLAADAVWQELEGLSAADVSAVRDRARKEYSADAMLDRDLALLEGLAPAHGPVVAALGRRSAALEDELAAERAHEVWLLAQRGAPGSQSAVGGTDPG